MDVVSAIKAELDKPKNVKKKFINKVVVRDDTLIKNKDIVNVFFMFVFFLAERGGYK